MSTEDDTISSEVSSEVGDHRHVGFFHIIFLCVRKTPTKKICTRQKNNQFFCVYEKSQQKN